MIWGDIALFYILIYYNNINIYIYLYIYMIWYDIYIYIRIFPPTCPCCLPGALFDSLRPPLSSAWRWPSSRALRRAAGGNLAQGEMSTNKERGPYPLVNSHIAMENHHPLWENHLFLWPFSIATLNYQRVYILFIFGM